MPRTNGWRARCAVLWLSFPLLARAGLTVQMPPQGAVVHSATPLVTGSAVAGDQVTVQVDGAPVGTVPAGADGTWRCATVAPLATGAHSVSASAPDAGGGVRSSGTNDFTVAPGLPAAPALLVPEEGAHVSRSSQFNFIGSAEAGTTVRLRLDGAEVPRAAEVPFAGCDALPQGGCVPVGGWRLTAPEAIERGAHSVTAEAVEPGGATSLPSPEVHFTVIGENYYAFGCSAAPSSARATWTALFLLGLARRRRARPNRSAPAGHSHRGKP